MSITPYYLQTETDTSVFTKNRNFGGQVSISFPLDMDAVELCKDLARKSLEKSRLEH
jgi:hypothetical protein